MPLCPATLARNPESAVGCLGCPGDPISPALLLLYQIILIHQCHHQYCSRDRISPPAFSSATSKMLTEHFSGLVFQSHQNLRPFFTLADNWAPRQLGLPHYEPSFLLTLPRSTMDLNGPYIISRMNSPKNTSQPSHISRRPCSVAHIRIPIQSMWP